MISPSSIMKAIGSDGRARLVPFFKCVCVYFAAGGGASVTGAALKVAPVLCLLLCVLLRACATTTTRHQRRYAWLISAGLALSAAGDALLVWPHRLEGGMAAFAGAHICYMTAFGLRPTAPLSALLMLLGAALYVHIVAPPAHLAIPVTCYALLLGGMAWRGSAKAGPQRLGSLLFVLSDAMLGYTLFSGTLPHQQLLVMSTYYVAQLCISLSALELPREPLH
ncbi:lysoplasmalogenase TMEM86B [Danaus plexippus]|uniref:lysoplasmalogenase TMEM86B n=1 Tax=Danaus plexippus TaxID=13037 RepID=UPI002AB22205|nr:lysoplasmalogenase TMEM86B [Danaus plexippus]